MDDLACRNGFRGQLTSTSLIKNDFFSVILCPAIELVTNLFKDKHKD